MNILRPSLVRSIIAIVVLGVSVPTLGMAFIVDSLAAQAAAKEEQGRLEYGKDYVLTLIRDRKALLSARIVQLADDPRLAQSLEAGVSERMDALASLASEYELASLEAKPEPRESVAANAASFEAKASGLEFRASAGIADRGGARWRIEATLFARRSIFDEFRRGLGQDIEIRAFDPSRALDRVELSTRLDPFGQTAVGIRGRQVSGTYLSDLSTAGLIYGERRAEGRVSVWLDFPLIDGGAGPYIGTVSRSFAHTLIAGNRLFVAAIALSAALLAALAAMVLAAWFAQPIKRLVDGMNGLALSLAAGQEPIRLDEGRRDEIGTLAAAYNRMARELKRTRDALDQRNREFEEMDRLKDEFLSAASHELRTPLAGIMGLAATMAIDAELPERFKGIASLVERSSRRLSAIVDNILDYTRLRRGELTLKPRVFDLAKSIDEVAAACAGFARLGVSIKTRTPRPAEARGDPLRVAQILSNLVCESLKFTDSGQVEIGSTREDGHWVVTVRDSGVPADRRQTGPLPLVEGANDLGTYAVGSSLGFAVAVNLVQLHGARFEFLPDPAGSGCLARFLLQATDTRDSPRAPARA